MTTLKAFEKTVAVIAMALAIAVAVCLLPENEYQRWQLLDGTIHSHLRWIYERCNFDPAPIDVAFVGPSRTGAGVDAPLLEKLLAARGLPSNVVNFSLPESGRNINFVIAEQLLKKKRPKLLVIGVTEKPSRTGHSTFKYTAPAIDIVLPGYVSDINFFSDLVYLPFRKLRLFMADMFPGLVGLTKTFDVNRYPGSTVQTTGSIVLPGGAIKEGNVPASAQELRRGVNKLERGMHPPILPPEFADIEFGDERHYVREIVSLAASKGVKVAFLALPYYTGPSDVQEEALYEKYGPVWNAGFLAPHAELYADYGHLTHDGADELTRWLATPLAATLARR
jgi:hypothetical protein